MSYSHKIHILLSTYNSEKYLKEQLDSLISQTYTDWQLDVRDDGSTDRTLDILGEYSLLDTRIVLLTDEVKHRGAKNSFFWLLKNIDSEYYMFCDHDDVWLPNKIELSFKKLLESEASAPNLPHLVCSDLKLVDSNLEPIHDSMWNYMRNRPSDLTNIYELAVSNYVTGCTIAMNKLAKNCSLPFPDDVFMHDWWIALSVCRYGKISIVDQSTILYRQHQSNTLGAYEADKKYYLNRVLGIFKTIKENILIYSNFRSLKLKNALIPYIYTKFKVLFRKMFKNSFYK